MTVPWEALDLWPVRAVLAGGGVLLVGRLLMVVARRPAQRAAIGTAAVAAALLAVPLSLLPGWVPVEVPVTEAVARGEPGASGEPGALATGAPAPAIALPAPQPPGEPGALATGAPATRGEPLPAPSTPVAHAPGSPGLAQAPQVVESASTPVADAPGSPSLKTESLVLAAYALTTLGLLARLLVGHLGLARLWRSARPAPDWAEQVFRRLAADCPRARLRVSPRVPGPVCFGVLRPRVLLPVSLLVSGDGPALRCVLAHELGHLRRRDPLAGWLLGLARAVYFVWPWLAGLRREVRVAQEHLADADAVAHTAGPADYAELLIRLSRARPAPLGAAGARGPRSDLYRRVSMLLRPAGPSPASFPRRWAIAAGGGLTALAILAAGLQVQPRPAVAAEPEKKEAPKPPAPRPESIKDLVEKLKKDAGDDPEARKKIEELEKSLKPAKPADPDPAPAPKPANPGFPGLPPGLLDPDLPEDQLLKELMEQQGQLLKQLEQMLGQVPRPGAGAGALPGRPGDPDEFLKMVEQMLGQLEQGQGFRGGLMLGPGGLRPFGGGGRLGVRVEAPSDVLAAQLDLPKGQGLVCIDVLADSPAARAGIKAHDVILEVAGKPVPSDVSALVATLKGVKADDAVDIVILRKGKKETLKGVKLPAAREAPERPALRFPQFPDAGLPALPRPDAGAVRPPAVAGPGESVRVEQVNDAFTVFYSKNGVKVTVAGTKEAGGAKAESIEVEDNGKTTKAATVDELPKEYQELARAALKAVK